MLGELSCDLDELRTQYESTLREYDDFQLRDDQLPDFVYQKRLKELEERLAELRHALEMTQREHEDTLEAEVRDPEFDEWWKNYEEEQERRKFLGE